MSSLSYVCSGFTDPYGTSIVTLHSSHNANGFIWGWSLSPVNGLEDFVIQTLDDVSSYAY